MHRLTLIQPYLTEYRVPVFNTLAEHYALTLGASLADKSEGFGTLQSSKTFVFVPLTFRSVWKFEWQSGIVSLLRQVADAVFVAANPRHLSYWYVLFYCRLKRIPVFCHGQGPYNKERLSWVRKALYRLEFALCERYVCYTPYSKSCFSRFGLESGKLAVAANSLQLKAVREPSTMRLQGLHVLFVGRLRKGSDLELLIRAMSRFDACPISLHVVGDGEMREELERAMEGHPWIHWYGSVYDQERIADIAEDCVLGCYPGDAGLSVLHYMALGLVPVIHDNMAAHMGPEPTYVEHGVNGFLFEYGNKLEALVALFQEVLDDRFDLHSMAEKAFLRYRELTTPSLGERLYAILHEAGI